MRAILGGWLTIHVALVLATPIAAVSSDARSELQITGVIPVCAKAGDTVTLSGRGFGAQNVSLMIGRDHVPFELIEPTGREVSFVVPEGLPSGLTTVRATNPGGIDGLMQFLVEGPESCDGIDNDCNGVVDDTVEGERCEGTRPDEKPRLDILSLVHTPNYPVVGERVQVAVELSNHWRDPASVPVDAIEVSLYADGEEVELRAIEIAQGGTQEVEFSWMPATEGVHRLAVLVDPRDELEGHATDPSSRYFTIVVAEQPPPEADFAVTGIEVGSAPGVPIRPVVHIENRGTASGGAPVAVLANGEPFGVFFTGLVGAGESTTIVVPWPSGEALVEMEAQVNPRFLAFEPDLADNVFHLFRAPHVDIAIDHVTVHVRPEAEPAPQERSYTISFRVSNVGRDTVLGPFPVVIAFGDDVPPITVATVPVVPAGEFVHVAYSFVGPRGIDFAIVADPGEVLSDGDRTNNLYSGSFSTVSTDLGIWRSVGPSGIRLGDVAAASGRIQVIAIDPTDGQTIYVGSPPEGAGFGEPAGSGIWKTMDGGATWWPLGDALPSLSIDALAVDPSNAKHLYAVTRNEGVFVSNDAGTSWWRATREVLGGYGFDGGALIVDPSEGERLYLTAHPGILRSTNGGRSWERVLVPGGERTDGLRSLVMDPDDPRHLIAAIADVSDEDHDFKIDSYHFNTTGIYESRDGGTKWFGSFQPGIIQIDRIDLSLSRGRAYAGVRSAQPGCYTLFRAEMPFPASSLAWRYVWQLNVRGACNNLWGGLYADPSDPDTVWLTGTWPLVSRTGGETFESVSGPSPPHADHHNMAFDPSDSRIVYAATDGGLFRSTESGRDGTWDFVSKGVTNFELYGIAAAPTVPLVIAGSQDNGTLQYSAQDPIWLQRVDGDGATVDFDPVNPQTFYGLYQNAESMFQVDGGILTNDIGPPVEGCHHAPLRVHPVNPSLVLLACTSDDGVGGLWRRDAATGEWSIVFAPPLGKVVDITVDPTNDVYYIGASSSRVFAGIGGEDVTRIPLGKTSDPVNVVDIKLDPHDHTTVYVALDGQIPDKRVYRLQLTSESPLDWDEPRNITGVGIPPGVTARTLGVDFFNENTVYLGTNGGVYRGRSLDGGATWVWDRYSYGLPQAVDVHEIRVHPITGAIFAATMGRSAYELRTGVPEPEPEP